MITHQKIASLILLIISSALIVIPMQSHANVSDRNKTLAVVNDVQKLKSLWSNYQDTLILMDKALNSIMNEVDDNARNAKISMYTKRLMQTKNAINQLVLLDPIANKLRQQIIEHATKYQNVYQLSATVKQSAQQKYLFERLEAQTTQLYDQILVTTQALK